MSLFNAYSHYDLLYRDKDYVGETLHRGSPQEAWCY